MSTTPETFIARWNGIAGSERSNYQLFIIELCELLDLPRPEPAGQNHGDNSYVFERHLADGNSVSPCPFPSPLALSRRESGAMFASKLAPTGCSLPVPRSLA